MSTDISSLVKQAAEAAKGAPEHLQEAAFNRAYETLLAREEESGATDSSAEKGTKKRTPKRRGTPAQKADGPTLQDLDRTAHADIDHNQTALVNSLLLLKAARDDLGIDGLTATEIASVLNEKFRVGLSREHVTRTLNAAKKYVTRKKVGRSVVFALMGAGEEYVKSLRAVTEGASAGGRKNRTRSKKKTVSAKNKASTKKKVSAKKAGARSGSQGATAAMNTLFESGFFSSPRKIGEMVDRLKHDQGRGFKSSALSPVLLRWLRSGKVSRTQDSDGQYQYQATK